MLQLPVISSPLAGQACPCQEETQHKFEYWTVSPAADKILAFSYKIPRNSTIAITVLV